MTEANVSRRPTPRSGHVRIGHNRPTRSDEDIAAARSRVDTALLKKYRIVEPHLRAAVRELTLADAAEQRGDEPIHAMIWQVGVVATYIEHLLPPDVRHLTRLIRRAIMVLEDIASGSLIMATALRPLSPDEGGSPARPVDARRRAFCAHFVAALARDRIYDEDKAVDMVAGELAKVGVHVKRGTVLQHHRAALARQPDLRPPHRASNRAPDGAALALFDVLQSELLARPPARWDTKAGRLAWLHRMAKKVSRII
jgi:hypothetical protein